MPNLHPRAVILGWVLALCLLAPRPARCEGPIVVIANEDNPNTIDRACLEAVYTGRTRGWPDGTPVFPLDQAESTGLRELFYTQFIGRSVADMQAEWAQNIFEGKGLPPKIASPDSQMRRIVSTNRNALGYIRATEVDDTLRVVQP